MADETSYMAHAFTRFFDSPKVAEHLNHCSYDYDTSWEFINLFLSLLSKQLPFLISFENTNTYVTTKGGVEVSFLPDLERLLSQAERDPSGGKVLLMHLPVFRTHSSKHGHSCIIAFDVRTKTQSFFDPMATTASPGISSSICSVPLVPGYSTHSMVAWTKEATIQHIVESTCDLEDTCSICCIMVTIAMCMTEYSLHTTIKRMTQALRRWDYDHVSSLVMKTTTWYQQGFVNANDGDPIPF